MCALRASSGRRSERMEVFFDIETTGLPDREEGVRISMIGVLSPKTGIRQFFGADCISDFLAEFMKLKSIAKDDGEELQLVSFNGNHFDVPLILKHSGKKDLDFSRDFENHCKTHHLDLFNPARQYLVNFGEPITEGTHYISKGTSCMKMNIYIPRCISAQKCAVVMKEYFSTESPKDFFNDPLNASEFYQVFQHNALDLVATSMLYHEFKRWGWI